MSTVEDKKPASADDGPPPQTDDVKEKLPLTSGWVLFKRFWPQLRPENGAAVVIGLLMILSLPSGVIAPFLVQRIFDDVLPSGDLRQLAVLGGVMLGLTLFSTAIGYLRGLLSLSLRNRVRFRMSMIVISHLVRLPVGYFDRHRSGKLMSRVRDDVAALVPLMTDSLLRAVLDMLSALLFFGLLFWFDPGLATSGIVLVAVVFGLVLLVSRPLRRRSEAAREADEAWSGALQELFGGIRLVRTSAQELSERRIVARAWKIAVRLGARRDVFSTLTESLFGLISVFGAYVILLIGAYRILSGTSSVGNLFAFFMYLMQFVGFVGSVASLVPQVQRGLASLERLYKVLDEAPEQTVRPSELEITAGPTGVTDEAAGADQPTTLQNSVRFVGVGFAYDEGPAVLRDIDLDVASGEVVAIVGRSGAGKSTLVQLLPRLYEPTEGRILIDGSDIRELPLRTLRRSIGVVAQDVFLFDRTIRENITYARRGCTEEELRQAARDANALPFVEALDKGFETLVGERGVRLSGGEKQRIAIARELLRDPPILVLDEVTSNLDAESEALIRDAIERLMQRRTCFVIAHRLSTIRNADRIVVLADGEIVEIGTERELLEIGGLFADLHRWQFER